MRNLSNPNHSFAKFLLIMSSKGEETSKDEAFNMQAIRQHLERIEIRFDQMLDRIEKMRLMFKISKVMCLNHLILQGRITGKLRELWKRRPKKIVKVKTWLEGIGTIMIGRIET